MIFLGTNQRPSHQLILKITLYLIYIHIHHSYIISIYYKLISRLLKNIPLFVGEFNSSIGENARISPSQYKQYIKRLNNFSIPGGLFWQWSYIEDARHPAFNLAKIVDERIHPNENFENYINAIKENKD